MSQETTRIGETGKFIQTIISKKWRINMFEEPRNLIVVYKEKDEVSLN